MINNINETDAEDLLTGRAVRECAERMGTQMEYTAIAMTALKLLVGQAISANATTLNASINGFTVKSVPHGDWNLCLTRIDDPPVLDQSGPKILDVTINFNHDVLTGVEITQEAKYVE